MRLQNTLRTPVSIEGIGLHSGRVVRATFRPAPEGSGIVLWDDRRPDLPIAARPENATSFDHATTLGRDDVRIGTVEHALSAAFGLGIDNLEIEVYGEEFPILDGSALPFVRLFQAAGVERQHLPVEPLVVTEPREIELKEKWIRVEPGSGLTITYEIDFPHRAIGHQSFTVELTAENFASRVAPARTFGFTREVEYLRARGLALGGSLQNAVVLDEENILSGPLRFVDEFVRHKTLDLIGDLALLGRPLQGKIHASRAGHALHAKLVAELENVSLGAAAGDALLERASLSGGLRRA